MRSTPTACCRCDCRWPSRPSRAGSRSAPRRRRPDRLRRRSRADAVTDRLPLDDELAPLFTVGQVAEAVGVQPAFLRRLDTFDVVSPARSAGAQRRYSRRDVTLIQQACGLIDEGLTLAGVRRVFELEAEVRALKAEIAQLKAADRLRRG